MMPILLILLTFFPIPDYILCRQATNINLKITNGKPSKGDIFIAIYQNDKGFPGNAKYAFKTMKSKVTENGISLATIQNVPAGNYAISIFQDENNDGILNTSIIGIPKEGYGFSNDAHSSFGPPNFMDCMFTHNGDTQISIKLKRW